MPKSEKVRVKMTGTTVWTIRPGDEVNIDEKMAKRWERGQLAVILNKPEELAEPTLSEMRKICEANGLAIRGTKAEVKARILRAFVHYPDGATKKAIQKYSGRPNVWDEALAELMDEGQVIQCEVPNPTHKKADPGYKRVYTNGDEF